VYYDDTWSFDGETWTLLNTSGPSPRMGGGFALDSNRGVIVLFGGGNESQPFGDTWEWDGRTWTTQSGVGENPAPRRETAMCYDDQRQVCVLFGGWNEIDGVLGDTWEWNGRQWALLATTGPSPRSSHAMVFDTARGVTVLHGGGTTSQPNNDTWEWDGRRWAVRSMDGPRRANMGLIYDSLNRKVVLFGGDNGPPLHKSGQTWEWNGASWTRRDTSGPPARYGPAVAFDAARGKAVVYGGAWVGSSQPDDTWECSMTNGGAEDVNIDCSVNMDDALMVINSWGPCSNAPQPCPADVQRDGTVDIDDLLLVINHWS
jgi:hypothetical protein